jgi:electron transfer flavoprotein beta subunit
MMRIVVAIKQILDSRGFVVNRKAEKIFVNREEWITNPADLCALEAALRLKDNLGGEVIVLSGGPKRTELVLRDAWARGADRAIHLADEAWSHADGLVAARILAKAVNKLGEVELVLCGDNALDSSHSAGEVGPRLAEALGWPQVLGALELSVVDGQVRAVKAAEKGYLALEARLPLLVTVAAGSNQPRFPHGARVINSYREYQLEVWTAAALPLSEDELQPAVESRGQAFPPPRELGTILSNPAELVGTLRRNRLI